MTNEEEIKSLRHSFTNPYREDLPKPKKNQFGHTVLNSNGEDINLENFDLSFDESGQVKASSKDYWVTKLKSSDLPEIEPEFDEDSHPSASVIPTNIIVDSSDKTNLISTLLSELDVMDGTSLKSKTQPTSDVVVQVDSNTKIGWSESNKSCLNKECLCLLPKDAKFCLKCGTPQMSKFCTECGYSFPGMEKFCPDCGNKR